MVHAPDMSDPGIRTTERNRGASKVDCGRHRCGRGGQLIRRNASANIANVNGSANNGIPSTSFVDGARHPNTFVRHIDTQCPRNRERCLMPKALSEFRRDQCSVESNHQLIHLRPKWNRHLSMRVRLRPTMEVRSAVWAAKSSSQRMRLARVD